MVKRDKDMLKRLRVFREFVSFLISYFGVFFVLIVFYFLNMLIFKERKKLCLYVCFNFKL